MVFYPLVELGVKFVAIFTDHDGKFEKQQQYKRKSNKSMQI